MIVLLVVIAVLLVLLLGKTGQSGAVSGQGGITGQVASQGGVSTGLVSPTPAFGAVTAPPVPDSGVVIITPNVPPIITPTTPPVPVPAAPTAVKVFYYEKELDEFTEAVGNSLMLHAQAYPVESFTNSSYKWSVSDPSVIKLEPDSYGNTCTLTILKHQPGGVTLTVECEGTKKDVKVYTKPGSSAGPVTLTADIQYRINIFLSNFSEQSFLNMQMSTAPDDQLMKFVWIYCKINNPAAIHYEGSYETVTLEDMNAQLNRFFGITRTPYEWASYMLDQWNSFEYHDGRFWFPAASGESYNKFTVAYEMMNNGDGTYTVSFQVFELGLEEYWNTPGINNFYYKLSNDETAAYVAAERIKPVQGGTAVVRDYTKSNGVVTYQLISYTVWDLKG